MKRVANAVNEQHLIPATSLDGAGLIALADLETVPRRTALLGMAPLVEALLLCPGMHRQQKAPDLSKAELPPTAAMTTGYVFRVENQATVAYLQNIGVTGQLVTLKVEKCEQTQFSWLWTNVFGPSSSIISLLLVAIASSATVLLLILLWHMGDRWGLGIIMTLMLSRSLNVYILHQRLRPSWHGVSEPGVQGDLLVLLSQDKWIRVQGQVDALKTVTSGQWLKDMTFLESSLEAIATIIVYLSAVLAVNATRPCKVLLMALLLGSAGLLGMSNHQTRCFYMHGHIVEPLGKPKPYARRLDLAKEMVKETGRRDWAIDLGMMKGEYHERKAGSDKIVL